MKWFKLKSCFSSKIWLNGFQQLLTKQSIINLSNYEVIVSIAVSKVLNINFLKYNPSLQYSKLGHQATDRGEIV